MEEIRAGNCVAFVGAGFSAPVIPHWGQLLLDLTAASDVDEETASRIARLVESARSKDLEAAAQTLRDTLGAERFAEALKAVIGNPPVSERMSRRLALLQGIPFRAVLTTNFDGLLAGSSPGRDTYLRVLRPSGHRW